jgi:hypothetical protein
MATEVLPRKDGDRKTALITIDADNRDRGKRFFIKEMPASQAERWALKVVAYLARRGVQVPVGAELAGMASLPSFSPLAMMSWIDDDMLIGEIMSCIQAWPEGSPIARRLVENDIEEILTRVYLKTEVIALHVGFSMAVVAWTLSPSLAAALNLPRPPAPPEDLSTTQTFPIP